MAYAKYRDVYTDRAGNAVASVSVAVTDAGTTDLSTIYSDSSGTLIEGNVVTTNSSGVFEFYALPGLYDLTFTKAGYTTTTETDVAVFASQAVIDAVNASNWPRVYPLWDGVTAGAIQFRGTADTAAALGSLGFVFNADSDGAAAALLSSGATDETSTINGASLAGTWSIYPLAGVDCTSVHIAVVGMTEPLSPAASLTVLQASQEFIRLDFDADDHVRFIIVYEGPPTNFAGVPGTGSARNVAVFGIQVPEDEL